MDYSSVNDIGPPSGFARRDAPQVQTRQDEPPPMQPSPTLNQPTQKQKAGNDEVLRQIVVDDEAVNLGEEYEKPKGADIGNYKNAMDYFYILSAILFIDIVLISLVRFLPEMFGQSLNRWYDFTPNAVIVDLLVLSVGFVLGRYAYTMYVKPKFGEGKWSPAMFTGVVVAMQLLFDLAFNYGLVQQVPRGKNSFLDLCKDYVETSGAKVLAGNVVFVVFSSLVAMGLKAQPMHLIISAGLLLSNIFPSIVYTRNQFTVAK
jgi:hypothetical protein